MTYISNAINQFFRKASNHFSVLQKNVDAFFIQYTEIKDLENNCTSSSVPVLIRHQS